jgi:glycine hydroxymethyltransferase
MREGCHLPPQMPEEARMTANLIADVLDNPRDAANIEAVRVKVNALTARFPVYK